MREAKELLKKRIGEIQRGKAASKSGREFARKPFTDAAKAYQDERTGHVSARTMQFEAERLKPFCAQFGDRPLIRLKAEDIASCQKHRLEQGVCGRTVNMEVGVLRRMMKRAKVWNVVTEDVRMFPDREREVAKVLTGEQKQELFRTAASNPDWQVAHCAAVLAVSTTCRGVELKNLRWGDVSLFDRVLGVKRSKTDAGHRTIPLNGDATAALARLWERAQVEGATGADHFVFPACENCRIDPTRPQKSWRTAWHSLVKETAKRAGREAAKAALHAGRGISDAKAAWRSASQPFAGFRFHDLRHQAITELAEAGASDATLMAVAGRMSRRMLEHYSHVRMAAKRTALDKLDSDLMTPPSTDRERIANTASGTVN